MVRFLGRFSSRGVRPSCSLDSLLAVKLLLILAAVASAYAQVQPNIENGFKFYGSYDSSKIDTVNLANGGLTLHIPLPLEYPQRGGKLTPSYFLLSTSKSWQVQYYIPPGQAVVYYWNYGPQANSGFFAGEIAGPLGPSVANTLQLTFMRWWEEQIDGSGNVTMWDGGYRIRGWDNAIHELSDVSGGKRNVFESMDTAGYRVVPSPTRNYPYSTPTAVTITDRKGNVYQGSMPNNEGTCSRTTSGGPGGTTTIICQQVAVIQPSPTDSNGNQLDTLGRSGPLGQTSSTSTTGCVSSLPLTGSTFYSYAGPSGTAEQIQACLGNLPISTSFGQSGVEEFGFHGAPNPASMIVTLILPNNAKWTFSYDSYGNVTKLGLPTGGSISYTWATIAVPNCGGSDAKVSRAVASRTFYDGTNSYTWNYTWGSWSGSTVTNVVTDPLNNDGAHVFTVLGGASSCSPYETATKSYSGSSKSGGTLLKETDTTYSFGSIYEDFSEGQNVGNVVPTNITTTDYTSGMVTTTTKSYDPGYGTNEPIFGNVISESDYDWGIGAHGALLKQTATTYEFQNNPTYLTANLPDLPASVVVSNAAGYKCSETDYTYDNSSYLTAANVTESHVAPPGPVRGNLSSTTRQLSSTPCQSGATWSPITSYTNMYDTGEVYQSIDPLGHTTTYGYSSTFYGAFPTTITNALNQSTTYNYDFSTGLLISVTDPNQVETTYSYDSMFRPLSKVTLPNNGSTTVCYTDLGGPTCTASGPPYEVVVTKAINSSLNETSTVVFDGLGRSSQTQLNSDPDGATYTQTTYDALGRVSLVYNPTRCNPPTTNCGEGTWGYTQYTYDPMGRTTQVLYVPDGSFVTTSYAGRATEVIDEGNGTTSVARVSQVDGLGRMVSVCEVSSTTQLGPGGTPGACGQDIAKTGFLTTYSYDTLDNLLTVSQGSLSQRTFTYDSLSRLLTATNPESGATSYSYDANGNLSSRARPAPNQTSPSTTVITTYSYDSLNRMTQKSYSDGVTPMVQYGYDQTSVTMGTQQFPVANGIGRLGWECTIVSNSCPTMDAFSYDPMGRPAQVWESLQHVNGSNIVLSYGYDKLGDEISFSIGNTPPGSTDFVATYGGAGRLTSYTTSSYIDSTNPANLVTGVHYDPIGHLSAATLANGLTQSWSYDDRLRPQKMAVGTNCSAGTCTGSTAYSFSVGYTPNSNVLSATDTVNGNWTYTYDLFNRLITNNCSANCPNGQASQGFSYGYDRYGNRWNQTVTAGSGPQPNASFTGAQNNSVPNNRMDSYSYDAAGNLLNDGTHSYTYDAENRIVSVDGTATTYVYDAEGRRFSKTTGSVTAANIYDREGHVVIYEPAVAGSAVSELYVAGMHLGTWVVNSTVTDTIFYYDHSDWLGTERARTNVSGVACETIASLPFGDEQTIRGTCGDISNMHFTGKERDAETGLDDFGARYYASTMGRFMKPDPVFISAARLTDPQSLNLYAYVRNNPLTLIDPMGLDFYLACQTSDHSGCGQVQNGSDKVWVQGQTVNGQFQATDVDMNKQGDPSAGYSDQFGNNYTGTFDQNGGVSFTNTAPGGATSTGSQFIDGSDPTQLNGSGAFANISGNFFSDCGGSCQGRASLSELAPGAFANTEAQLHKQGGLMTAIDLLSGAHKPGSQWKDSNGYVHMLNPSGQMEMHFEGHPTGVDVQQFVLHMVDTIRDAASGRAAAEKNTPLP